MLPLALKRLLSAYAKREEYGIPTVKKRDEVESFIQQNNQESII
jgi:hypothetical protein